MRAWVIALLAIGCSSPPEPKTVVVERKVYVFVPEKSGPPVPPGEGIAPSPLLVEAEQRRADSEARRLAATPPPAPEVVYAPTERDYWPGYYPGAYVAPVYRQPEPETTVVIVHDHDHKRHRVNHHSAARERRIERKVERCERRGTEWARKRCIKQAAR